VFSKATQLLREDLTHKPDLRWLYAILLTLAIVAIALALYIKRKHRKHQLISQQVEDLQQKHDELSEQNLLLESNLSKRQKKMLAEIEAFCKTIQDDSDLKAKLSWNNFDKMCEIVDDRMYGLATKLKERYSMDLNNLRICVLITIGNFTNKEMATILSYDEHTFRTIKNRVAKNLNVSGKNMRDFFLKETIGA
jgi:DNA-binding CsgD family transcriptional regulator